MSDGSGRLNALCAESLEVRRLKLDLTMMYKISRSIVAIDDSFFSFTINSQTRGKVFKPQCTNNARAFSFSCRRVNCWNSLPDSVRCAPSLYSFKSLLNDCDFTAFLEFLLIFVFNFVSLGNCKCHLVACLSVSLCFVVSVSLYLCHV